MRTDYLEILENSRKELIDTLADSIRIKSVKEPPVTLADGTVLPFGQGVENAYQHMLGVGREMGFETFDAVSLSAARSRKVGRVRMMTAQNPVMIYTFENSAASGTAPGTANETVTGIASGAAPGAEGGASHA